MMWLPVAPDRVGVIREGVKTKIQELLPDASR